MMKELYNNSAEQSVIGALMLDNQAWDKIGDLLTDKDFFIEAHQLIYCAITTLLNDSRPADWLTVSEHLKNINKLAIVGGDAYLVEMLNQTPTSYNILSYAKIVKKHSIDRQIRNAALQIIDSIESTEETTESTIEYAQKLIFDISENKTTEPTLLNDGINKIFEEIQSRKESKGKILGLSTGFDKIDNIIKGLRKQNLIILAARPGMGKAQPMDAKILTQNGFVYMSDLKLGDKVIGSNGKPILVEGIYPQGVMPIYKVKFTDGTSTECTLDHLWFTQTRNERKCKKKCDGSVKTLKEIIKTLKREDGKAPNHAVKTVNPVEFEPIGELKINPYLLGLLIGDACLNKKNLVFSKPEIDIHEKIKKLLPSQDQACYFGYGYDLAIKRKVRNNTLCQTVKFLEEYGLFGCRSDEKFIPKEYLYSSINDRLELLRGLVDTDGHVTESGKLIEYCTVSEQLAKDFIFIAQSLGGNVRTSIKKAPIYTYKGAKKTGKKCWRIYASFPCDIVPVSSKKNMALWTNNDSRRPNHKSILSVDYVGEKECQCIKVSAPDSLYVTDDFILTHNTALSLNIARNVGIGQQTPVLFFSLEMSKEELTFRYLSDIASVRQENILTGQINDQEETKLADSLHIINLAKIMIDDNPALTISDIRAKCRRIKRQQGLGLVIIDYLTLIKSESKSENETQRISTISRNLKALAKELDVPVIALSQLNRGVESRDNKRPGMSDLRQSGQIEQDADIIMFIYRDSVYNEDSVANNIAEIIISKNRSGQPGKAYLTFHGEYCRFENYSGAAPNYQTTEISHKGFKPRSGSYSYEE